MPSAEELQGSGPVGAMGRIGRQAGRSADQGFRTQHASVEVKRRNLAPLSRIRSSVHSLDHWTWIIVGPDGDDLPVNDSKAIHYRDHAEGRIEVEDASAPLTVHDVSDDLNAVYRGK